VSFAWNIEHVGSDPVGSFYLPGARFWELLSGSMLAYLALHRKEWFAGKNSKFQSAQGFAGAALLIIGLCLTTSKSAFPGWWALFPIGGAVLIISAGPSAWFNRAILGSRPLVWIGLISFPLYLWHWPLLTFARIIESQQPAPAVRITAVLLAVALAWLTYRLVERPIRGGASNLKTPILTTLMLAMGLTGYATYAKDGLPARANIRSAEAINAQFVGPIWKYTQNETCLKKYPFKDAENYSYWFCMANSEAAPTVLIIGNSYANQMYYGLANNPVLSKNSILSIGDCDIARGSEGPAEAGSRIPCRGEGPERQLQFIDGIVAANSSIQYVIIDGLSYTPDAQYTANLEKIIARYEAGGKKVIVFRPHFRLDYDIKACFARPLKEPQKDCLMPMERAKDLHAAFEPLVTEITAKHPEVKFFDQNQLFCDDKQCSMVKDGLPLYRDEYHHLSVFGSGELAAIFAKWAETNAPGILKK